jgi:hypothetical protein
MVAYPCIIPLENYPKHPVHKMGKFTHFVYGMFWVKIGDRARILQIKNPGDNTRGFV